MEAEKTEQTTAGEIENLPENDPAGAPTEDPKTDAPQSGEKRPSWEEILADPEYRKQYDEAVGRTVQRRLRSRAEAEQRLSALGPVLDALRERYGEQDETALAALIRRGECLYGPEEIRLHLDGLLEQAEQLHSRAPDFDLLRALEDPAFLRLTAPHSGVSLAAASVPRPRGRVKTTGAEAGQPSIGTREACPDRNARSSKNASSKPKHRGGSSPSESDAPEKEYERDYV